MGDAVPRRACYDGCMRTFVLPDLHGRHRVMADLLEAAGVAEGGERADGDFIVVSVGDMINGTSSTWDDDERILREAEGLVDLWCIGNHDAAYDYPHMGFSGFAPSAPVRSGLNRWMRSGRLVPGIL